MLRYISIRLVWLAFILMGICLITFIITRVVPSDPAALYLGPKAKAEQVAEVKKELGLDRPLPVQFVHYTSQLLKGNLGNSLRTHQPVLNGILNHLPASLELMLTAIVIALALGIPLGVFSAAKENTAVDHSGRILSVACVSLPSFWLAMILQILFFKVLGIFPVGGRLDTVVSILHPIETITGFNLIDSLLTGNWPALKSSLHHLILPSLTLSAYSLGLISRMTRATMLEIYREDYITTARAIGVPESEIMFHHALKNSLNPSLTAAGLCFAYMLLGTFFIEIIFFWPGLGSYMVKAIFMNDYPVIIGCTIVVAFFYVLVNLTVDLLQASIDPRLRLE